MRYRSYLTMFAVGMFLSAAAYSASGPQKAAPDFKISWVSKTGEWNKGIALAPWGDVVSASSGGLRVHARDTGQIVDEIKVCWIVGGGIGFKDEKTAVVVCDEEIDEVAFPGGSAMKTVKLKEEAELALIEGGLAVLAGEKGTVEVLSLKDWKVVDSFQPGGDVESVALSPKGDRLAVGTESGKIILRDIAAQKSKTFYEGEDTGISGLAFSPDGTRLFGESGIFKAALWDLEKGTMVHKYKTGSWIVSARFVSPTRIAAAGSDGLVLYEGDGEPVKVLAYTDKQVFPSADRLAVSAGGDIVAVGDRDGMVACFSLAELKPSGYAGMTKGAASGPSAPTGAQVSAAAKSESELLGEIDGRKGKVVVVKVYSSALPPAGAAGTLYKHFEKKLGGFTASGWLEIAAVKVKKVGKDKLHLEVMEERSAIEVQGKKINHFKTGTKIKLVLPSGG